MRNFDDLALNRHDLRIVLRLVAKKAQSCADVWLRQFAALQHKAVCGKLLE